jgi:hypothetical protein
MQYRVSIDENNAEAGKVISMLNKLSEDFDFFSLDKIPEDFEISDELKQLLDERSKEIDENPGDFMLVQDYEKKVLDKML